MPPPMYCNYILLTYGRLELLTLEVEGLDEELELLTLEDLELLDDPTELLLLDDLLGEKEDLELLVFELDILELLLVLDGAAELLVVVRVLAEDRTVRDEGTAVLFRVDDVDTPLADVDLTLAFEATVPLFPVLDLVIALVLLELFTLLTLDTLFTLVNLALLMVVNPYGGQAYPPPKELNPNPLLKLLNPNPLLKLLNPNPFRANGENELNPLPTDITTLLDNGLNNNWFLT